MCTDCSYLRHVKASYLLRVKYLEQTFSISIFRGFPTRWNVQTLHGHSSGHGEHAPIDMQDLASKLWISIFLRVTGSHPIEILLCTRASIRLVSCAQISNVQHQALSTY